MATDELRRTRERELVVATRALFDERGMQDAPIEEIAKAVGIARGLVYRQFSSKEELFVLTVTDYLDELAGVLAETAGGVGPEVGAAGRLEASTRAYARFCLRYPAFLDSALSLMRRPARDLRDMVSESIWLRLGEGMAACIEPLAGALREAGQPDPDFSANVLWTQTLGVMHLARIRVGLRREDTGEPGLFAVDPERVVEACVASALAAAGVRR